MVLRVFENGKQEWLTLRELFEQCKVCIELTGYDFKVKKNKQYNRIYRYSRLKDTIIPSIFVVKEIIPEAKKEDVVCENIRVQQEPTKNEKLKNRVIEVLSNHKEVTCYSSGYINGYYTRTIFEERILKKEIIIKVLVVYMDAESSELVQVNVDVENLYGGLLETSCFDGKDFNEIADEVVHFACVYEELKEEAIQTKKEYAELKIKYAKLRQRIDEYSLCGNTVNKQSYNEVVNENAVLKQQIGRMKCCANCKSFDVCAGDYLRSGFRGLVNELKQPCYKWELAD